MQRKEEIFHAVWAVVTTYQNEKSGFPLASLDACCVAFHVGAVAVSVGEWSQFFFFSVCVVFQCSPMFKKRSKHLVSKSPRNQACVRVGQFHKVVNLATLQVTPFLFVLCYSGSSFCSKQNGGAAGNMKHITYWATDTESLECRAKGGEKLQL